MKFFIITLFTYYFYNILKYRRGLYMLQQNIYNEGNRYLKWIFRNFKETVFNIDLYTFLLVIATLFLNQTVYMILIILTYLLLAYIELNRLKNEQKKIKFKVTARIKRLITTIFIIFLIINLYIYYNYNVENEWIYFLLMFIFSYLSYCIIYIVNIINKPIEKMVYKYYYNKAKSKIKAMNSLHVVGITGSYGKTSSKEILNTILNTKYISLKTPKSYNTPFGLMITINNMLDKFTNVFIAEMGAYKIGEIKQNCELVNPKYAIITKIGLAHLETFKSEENIQKGKFELVEYLPSDGVAVLNKDDIKQTSYKIKNNCKIIWIGINSDADVKASDIKLSNKGTTFNVKFKDDKKLYSFQTVLLGEHNVYNI
ncbi:MAG: Mur ligase family protein, partial [Bacilli bacterium]|nr:Mur ligase family protein [Bacilli bacterium]